MKIILTLLLLYVSVSPAYGLTKQQKDILYIAYIAGSTIGFPETIQAIALVESSAGGNNSGYIIGDINKGRSYGVAQIKLETAKFVIKFYKLPSFKYDELLILKLLQDNTYNLFIATLYFKYLYMKYNNWVVAIVAYNYGPGGVKLINPYKTKYLAKIRWQIFNVVRPLNDKKIKK